MYGQVFRLSNMQKFRDVKRETRDMVNIDRSREAAYSRPRQGMRFSSGEMATPSVISVLVHWTKSRPLRYMISFTEHYQSF